ncbi:MAG: hypothetical protein R2824_14105 [Saprospiraceae bacterium]|nr:hypothetical protein [Lewinella sp.]
MKRLLPLLSLLLFCFACQTSKPLRLSGVNMEKLEPLVLEPGYDPYALRIDVLRQKESGYDPVLEQYDEEDAPYHPVGFDLGNGLFFDLNYNLSFKVNQLPGITDPNTFKVRVINNLLTDRGTTYTIEPEQYCVEKRGKQNCYNTPREGDKLMIFGKRKLNYAIEEGQDQLTYIPRENRPRLDVEILPNGEDHYYTDGKGNSRHFFKKDNEINLVGRYLIKEVSDGKRLEIYKIWKRVNKVLFAIEKSDNTFYIYNRHRKGKKIEYDSGKLEVVRNNKVRTRIEILD